MPEEFPFDCNAVLSYDPDADSKGDGVKKIADKIVRRRKAGECATCFGPIAPRDWVRAETGIVDGKLKTILHCTKCCIAMARWPVDPTLLNVRHAIGESVFRQRQTS